MFHGPRHQRIVSRLRRTFSSPVPHPARFACQFFSSLLTKETGSRLVVWLTLCAFMFTQVGFDFVLSYFDDPKTNFPSVCMNVLTSSSKSSSQPANPFCYKIVPDFLAILESSGILFPLCCFSIFRFPFIYCSSTQ